MKYLPTNAGLSGERILDALAALGITLVIDPEHGPETLTDEHIPELLGALVGTVDTYAALVCGPGEEAAAARFVNGYLANGALETGHVASEVTLTGVGMRINIDASIVRRAVPGNPAAGMAASALELASALTMYASALAFGADGLGPQMVVSDAEMRVVHQEVRRRLTAVRGALGATERHLKGKGHQL